MGLIEHLAGLRKHDGNHELFSIELEEISFVDEGDDPRALLAFFKRRGGDEVLTIVGKVEQTDDDQMIAFGWAYVSMDETGALVIDHSGDTVAIEELERAAYDYVLFSRAGGEMHEGRPVATLIESVVFTPEKIQQLGLEAGSLPHAWWVGFKVHDPVVWGAIKGGTYKAFSIGGKAKKRPRAAAKNNESGRTMTATAMNKRADVLDAATAEARAIQKTRPELSLPAARSLVWKQRPDLAERYHELPHEEPRPAETIVQKGAVALAKHSRAVEQLRKSHPDKGESELRMLAWRETPGLRDEYEREVRGA